MCVCVCMCIFLEPLFTSVARILAPLSAPFSLCHHPARYEKTRRERFTQQHAKERRAGDHIASLVQQQNSGRRTTKIQGRKMSAKRSNRLKSSFPQRLSLRSCIVWTYCSVSARGVKRHTSRGGCVAAALLSFHSVPGAQKQRRLRADGTGGFDTHTHTQSPDYFRHAAHTLSPSSYSPLLHLSSSLFPYILSLRTLLIYPVPCRSDIHPSEFLLCASSE